MSRYKKCLCNTKKSQKLGIFGHKKAPQYREGDIWHILNDVPGGFFNDFS
jgi:hypothetical protein